ncbi:MAG: glutamine synthetase beta-grasp domain-containing protein, partial [Isosphaeraceae bacterium]
MSKSPNDVKKLVEDSKIEIIDLRFVDLPGVWQHFSMPARTLSDDMFTDGLGFDGSSIRGYQQIQESDMLLIPDPETAFVDPVLQVPTLSMICSVQDPVTRESYTR